MTRFVNLTPHDVAVHSGDRVVACWPTTGRFARRREVARSGEPLTTEDGIRVPVRHVTYAEDIDGLPDPVEGTTYIVSRVLAEAAADRTDLVFPYDEIRDGSGRIVGCRALARFTAHSEEVG